MSAVRSPVPSGSPAAWLPVLVGARHHSLPLAALERGWKQLQRRVGVTNPFLSWEWQSAWAAQLPRGVAPVVVAQPFPDGSLAGLLALQWRRHQGLAQLEFLGEGSGGDDLDCLLDPRAPAGTAERLLAAALRQRRWQRLRLESADAGGALAQLPWVRTEAAEWLPTLELPASFDAYLAAQSPNFRAEIRRRRRRFVRQWPQARLDCAAAPAAVAAALPHLFRLHNLRRTQHAAAGIFESPRLRAFHLRAAPGLAALGVARVYLLRTPETILAVLYGLEAGPAGARRFLYFQSGFDPAATAFSPGTVLLSAVIEDCMARGLRSFDFLRGEEGYKARWTSARHSSLRLLAVRGAVGTAWLRLREGWHWMRSRKP
ncbi:MAG: GNAT family N-acetyltransferase [Terriglobales bacterium]